MLEAFESICRAPGYSTNNKNEGNRRAGIEILNIRVAQQIDLLVDVTLRHDFIGAGRWGYTGLYYTLS